MTGRGRPHRDVSSLLLLITLACAGDPEVAPGSGSGDAAEDPNERNFTSTVYERNLVFITLGGDSAIVVPWLFRAESRPDGVDRDTRGWLSRGDSFDPFFADRWRTGPARSGFRIHPRGPVDLVVGADDALEAILYSEGSRDLESILDEPIAEWSGTRGETIRLHRGALLLGGRRLEARVVDLTRSRTMDQPGAGDWMVLESGPSLSLVLAAPLGEAAGNESFLAWALEGEEELRWTDVDVTWTDLRAFEEARRDIPVAWEIASRDGELAGALVSTAQHLSVGDGEGPLLPVEGLFRVDGHVRIRGDSLPVRGLIRHIQR